MEQPLMRSQLAGVPCHVHCGFSERMITFLKSQWSSVFKSSTFWYLHAFTNRFTLHPWNSSTGSQIQTHADGKVCVSEIPAAVVMALTLFLATECLLICTARICNFYGVILYSFIETRQLFWCFFVYLSNQRYFALRFFSRFLQIQGRFPLNMAVIVSV